MVVCIFNKQTKNRNMNYIAYYRVSTQQQGRSGLGLESQMNIVRGFVKDSDTILSEYTDIESGKNNNRPQLLAAIQKANETGATLLIAKLDRLSRNAGFIFMLRDSKVNFVCCDMPEANTLTIGIFATVAQYERELISQRTKSALTALKQRGCKLGNPNGFASAAQTKATATKQAKAANNTNAIKAKTIIKDIIELYQYRNQRLTIADVASELNRYGCTTASGQRFTASNVRRILDNVKHGMNLQALPKPARSKARKTVKIQSAANDNYKAFAA